MKLICCLRRGADKLLARASKLGRDNAQKTILLIPKQNLLQEDLPFQRDRQSCLVLTFVHTAV